MTMKDEDKVVQGRTRTMNGVDDEKIVDGCRKKQICDEVGRDKGKWGWRREE